MEILKDSILDVLKLIPFLLIAFLMIEFIEHKLSDKVESKIKKAGRFGPMVGGTFGAIPQCGMSLVCTNLFITRIISMGTLFAIYLSTSDEMLPIMLSSSVNIKTILGIILFKACVGIIFGFIIDFVIPKKKIDADIFCKEEDCDCNHHSIFTSAILHTIKSVLFIFLATLVLNLLFSFVNEEVLEHIFLKDSIVSIFIAPLFGMIPTCASSIFLTELYIHKAIKLSVLMAGLLPSSGVALLFLVKSNKDKKENLFILSTLYFIGMGVGLLLFCLRL